MVGPYWKTSGSDELPGTAGGVEGRFGFAWRNLGQTWIAKTCRARSQTLCPELTPFVLKRSALIGVAQEPSI